ncbi:hypothetical protein C9374_011929 [Naegleria lovaniensis]|uniref:Uncharacterized protein n=1 Tax=Naegleria lovaniensis TaxID=51637 RepID=A0AA88KC95_NAELO|nr:uncharacterized protein C9374_011929 [Naegleria lovaniensis]KAG2373640.1 hypothetical protein C9374_011929 [Naegleria lovaniensis]
MIDPKSSHDSSSSTLPTYSAIPRKEIFRIKSARSHEQAEASFTSLLLQRLKYACSSLVRGSESKYVAPGRDLLEYVWGHILLCFKIRLENGKRATCSDDADIADILEFFSHAHWIYLQPSMRENLYIGFNLNISRALYYNAKVDETKKTFDLSKDSDTGEFSTNFLISNHVIRNLDCELASSLLRYFVNVFTEEMNTIIQGGDNTLKSKELSLAKYLQQYESIKHMLETIRDYYVHDMDEKFGAEIQLKECIAKDHLPDVSKLIACMNYIAIDNRQRSDCKDIRLFFHQLKNVYIKRQLLEQVVTLSFIHHESDLCEFIRDIFSDYITFRPRTLSLKDLMYDLNTIIASKKIKKVTDATGMTLCCLYLVLKSSHAQPNVESLQLDPSQHQACQEFAANDFNIDVTDELLAPEMIFLLQNFVSNDNEMQDE